MAALVKGASMGVFGVWVIGYSLITNYDFLAYETPGRFLYMKIGKQF